MYLCRQIVYKQLFTRVGLTRQFSQAVFGMKNVLIGFLGQYKRKSKGFYPLPINTDSDTYPVNLIDQALLLSNFLTSFEDGTFHTFYGYVGKADLICTAQL